MWKIELKVETDPPTKMPSKVKVFNKNNDVDKFTHGRASVPKSIHLEKSSPRGILSRSKIFSMNICPASDQGGASFLKEGESIGDGIMFPQCLIYLSKQQKSAPWTLASFQKARWTDNFSFMKEVSEMFKIRYIVECSIIYACFL